MTRLYRRRPEHLPGKQAIVMAACRPGWRFGVILAQEDERWIVTLGGYLGDRPPMEDAGYIEFARSLPKPEIFEVIKDAEPLTPLTPYQFNANLRRHYEELSCFPEGLLVFGEALCSFNPIYGQGMTVACARWHCRSAWRAGRSVFARRFFQMARKLIDIPWQIAVGSDLENPTVAGKRTAQTRFVNWYLAKLFQAAQYDAELATRFLEVANMMKQPPSLM